MIVVLEVRNMASIGRNDINMEARKIRMEIRGAEKVGRYTYIRRSTWGYAVRIIEVRTRATVTQAKTINGEWMTVQPEDSIYCL
jgi:hypothetical protein